MAQPFANPFPIVGPQYCAPSNQEIVLVFLRLENGDVVVADVNGSIKFISKEVHRTLAPNLRIIHDVAGKPIVTMKPKVLTAHSRWEVFRGDSKDFQNLIFTAKTHSMVNLKTKLDVFLANNTAEKVPDFKVKGSFLKKSCTIFAGDQAPIIIAEKKENEQNVDNILVGGDNFMATVNPNVDYAFIVALIVILEEINRKSVSNRKMAVSSTANVAIALSS